MTEGLYDGFTVDVLLGEVDGVKLGKADGLYEGVLVGNTVGF